jgi:hypothetical protein
VGYEPTQIHRLVDATEDHLCHVHEEKEHDTKALKKAKEEALEKH